MLRFANQTQPAQVPSSALDLMNFCLPKNVSNAREAEEKKKLVIQRTTTIKFIPNSFNNEDDHNLIVH